MRQKVALLVGATAGIGKETARLLAANGYKTIIVGRNQLAGDELATSLNGTFIRADMSLMSETRRVAQEVRTLTDTLDLIIHTADVLIVKRQETTEGLEIGIATNYYSRFLLNHLLLNESPAYKPDRVVHVAAAGYPAGKNFKAKFPVSHTASSFTGHGIGQVANDFYGLTFAEKQRANGIKINILNPGMVDTDIRRRGSFPTWVRLLEPILDLLLKPMLTTPEEYARLVLAIALGHHAEANQSVLINRKGKAIKPSGSLADTDTQSYVWQQTENQLGITTKSTSAQA